MHFQEFDSEDGNQSQLAFIFFNICKDPQAFLTLSQRHRFVQATPRPFASYSVLSARISSFRIRKGYSVYVRAA